MQDGRGSGGEDSAHTVIVFGSDFPLNPLFPEFSSFPCSPLPRFADMQDQSTALLMTALTPTQSIAALLPPEIVDCIFSHFDFDYSIEADEADGIERTSNLSNMSVIAEGWKGPARRLLCRTVCVWSWDRLAKGVPEWARGGLQNAQIDGDGWEVRRSEETAGALFHFLRGAPSLRLLRIDHLPFASFNPADSMRMRTTHLLSRLRDLTIFGDEPVPHAVISDILATSNRQISHLHLRSARRAISPIPSERLDFGGTLRYLRVEEDYSLLNCFQPLPHGLVGLREMRLAQMGGESGVRAQELLTEVAPSLEKLTIANGDVTGIVDSFPLLTRLTRVSLSSVPALPDSLLLPPSLVSLQLWNDDNLLPLFDRWTTTPFLLPDTLQQVIVQFIRDRRTLERLPPVAEFGTVYAKPLEDMLRQRSPLTLPFTTLSVYFYVGRSGNIAMVEAECKRLGVKFCRKLEMWTH